MKIYKNECGGIKKMSFVVVGVYIEYSVALYFYIYNTGVNMTSTM